MFLSAFIGSEWLIGCWLQFSEAASLIVYAGYNATYDNGTVLSDPRTISTPVVSVFHFSIVFSLC
jgi:hypothetical protein